jgi:hypothetical protein
LLALARNFDQPEGERPLPGCTVNVPVAVLPPAVAVIVTTVGWVTTEVEIVNDAEVAFGRTVMIAGTDAHASLLLSATSKPFTPAATLIVTVPVADCWQMTEVGTIASAVTAGGTIVRSAEAEELFADAETTADSFAGTTVVVIVKVAVLAPEATVTLAGTAAYSLPDLSATFSPPDLAAALSVTVPVSGKLPVTVFEPSFNDFTVCPKLAEAIQVRTRNRKAGLSIT